MTNQLCLQEEMLVEMEVIDLLVVEMFAGGGDLGDSYSSSSGDNSCSSLPDLSKFLRRRKSHWTDGKK